MTTEIATTSTNGDSHNREALRWILQSPDFSYFKINTIMVANTVGSLSIEKQNTKYVIIYSPNPRSYSIFGDYIWEINNPDEVVDIIAELPNSVYIDREEIKSPGDLQDYFRLLSCILYYWGSDHTCYVCHGETYGFMTDCKHSICVYCYQKSIKDSKFTCGICRLTFSE